MLGFYIFLAIVSIICALVFLVCTFLVDKKWLMLVCGIVLVVISLFLFNYTYEHEASYYEQKGNPKTLYAQVQSKSENKISLYISDREGTSTFTLYSSALHSSVSEGDIVKVVYVRAIYRAFAISLQKYVPST